MIKHEYLSERAASRQADAFLKEAKQQQNKDV